MVNTSAATYDNNGNIQTQTVNGHLNHKYKMDTILSTPIKWIASPKDYIIRISWKDSSSACYLNYKRLQITSKGYPFIYE